MTWSSQSDWLQPERARRLLALLASKHAGTPRELEVNQKHRGSLSELTSESLHAELCAGRVRAIRVFGDEPVPFDHGLTIGKIRTGGAFPIGKHVYGAGWTLERGADLGALEDLRPLVDLMVGEAGPLDLRMGRLGNRTFEAKRVEVHRQWVSPQYLRYAERVMLFGPREIERFGERFLLDAPAHDVRCTESGHVLMIAGPDALDGTAIEDEKALDALYAYLMSHPEAGKLL